MNIRAIHVMTTPLVRLTMKVLLTVNVMLGILEMDLIVQVNINECLINPCHPNATCTDNEGSFVCECNVGFSGNGFNCSNINECSTNPCHPNATCTDNEGSFVCECNVGYSGNGFNCSNINECLINPCHPNATCTDNEGSFVCECNVGFSGSGFNCSNINECSTNPCHPNATCTDNEGSFVCECNVGFSGNGFNCSNINECSTNPCHPNATCTDNEGSFVCECNVGYSGNGFNCSNINECSSKPCHPDATCTDNEGSFVCECNVGYNGTGFKCSNINECSQGNPCHRNATCTDNEGSFDCDCNLGYSGNGFNCSNIDECLLYPCHANASCTDNDGSFECRCRIGFSGDGFSCTAFTDVQMDVQYSGYAGGMLEITCTVTGPSLPSFEWRKNNMILSLSTRVKIENNDKVSKLFVRKTAKPDSGNYYCIASKGEDTINSSVPVEVKLIPVVAVFPLSVSATEGDTIMLTCKISVGDEENIEVMWYNSKQSGSVGQTRKLDLSSIELSDGDQRYKAEYWCFAKNSDGPGRSQNVTVYIISRDFNEFCLEDNGSGYTWEKTPVGTSVIKNCPVGTIGTVTRFCKSNDGRQPVWGDVNLSNCRSRVVINLVDKISRLDEGFESENISDILGETEKVTEDGKLYEKDVENIVYILEKTKKRTKTQNDRQNFIRSSSNIVSQKRKDVWKNIPARNDLAKQIISGTDLNAKNYISQSAETGKVVSYSTPNIAVRGIRLPTVKPTEFEPKDISLLDTGGQGVIVPDVVTNEIDLATVVQYSSIKDILSEIQLKETVDSTIGSTESLTIRSTIVSFTTEPQLKNKSVSEPFKIVLQNNLTGYEDPRRTCAFFEPDKNNSILSSEGCTLNEAESSVESVTCDCDHNTAFAVMMDVSGVQLTESERKILEMISTVGCSISLVGIVLTILMQALFWKQVKSLRAKILVSLCVAIGFTDVFAILEGVAKDSSQNSCKAVAALLHFFVLSAFGWMLCEGILLYFLLIRVFEGVRGKHWKIFNFIGWGIPLLIVVVSLGTTQGEGYGTESSCWLSVGSKVIWAFVGPAVFVILANIFVFVMILRTMKNFHTVEQQTSIAKVKTGVKTAMAIFPILGLTWVFGLMTFNRETVVFRYLFAVFNSAQGLFIFLFHCVLNKQMREVVHDSITKRSSLSSSFGTKRVGRSMNSSSLPSKTGDSDINPEMVEKNAMSSKSECGAHNLNISVAEEANEHEENEETRHSSPNASVRSEHSLGRNNDAVEMDSKGYHSGESENSSSADRHSDNEDAHLNGKILLHLKSRYGSTGLDGPMGDIGPPGIAGIPGLQGEPGDPGFCPVEICDAIQEARFLESRVEALENLFKQHVLHSDVKPTESPLMALHITSDILLTKGNFSNGKIGIPSNVKVNIALKNAAPLIATSQHGGKFLVNSTVRLLDRSKVAEMQKSAIARTPVLDGVSMTEQQ
ncbi:adhesion G -coupled receptor L3-like, partial [Paramuricea clavata]